VHGDADHECRKLRPTIKVEWASEAAIRSHPDCGIRGFSRGTPFVVSN
jgi:hypothetical protein